MLAVKHNHEKVVQLLLEHKPYPANPFLTDQLGHEALDYKIAIVQANNNLTPVDLAINRAK